MLIIDELKKHINKDLPIRENVNYFRYICEQHLDTTKVFAFADQIVIDDFDSETVFTFSFGIQLTENLQRWTVRTEFTYFPEQAMFFLEHNFVSENLDDFFRNLKKSEAFLYIEKNDIKPIRIDFIAVPM